MDLSELMLAVIVLFLTYRLISWYKNPLRLIPGPTPLPIVGNALSLKPELLHRQFYEMVEIYGPVFKVYVFGIPLVVLSSTEASLEALVKRGTDFQGRPPTARMSKLAPKELVFSSYDEDHHLPLRRLFTKAMKAYGPGVAHLEEIIQETILDIVDGIQALEDGVMNTEQLCNGYVCCVMASLLFGEKYCFTDPICQSLHDMNLEIMQAADPVNSGALLDLFPVLFKFKFVLADAKKLLEKVTLACDEYFHGKIDEAKTRYTKGQVHGWLDYLLEVQQQEVDEKGKPKLSDVELKGLVTDALVAGMETSTHSLSQAFLDLLNQPDMIKELQAEIDAQFDPVHRITLKDKDKLPLLQSFLLESIRHLSLATFLVPHMTIRDTQVGGYQIPAKTRVLINNYYTSHNPHVYEEPFKFKLRRFLDKDGQVVAADHPARYNLLSFGSGRRQCPGELLAKSRIFLLLANILQKFDLDPVGELPDGDVRKYKMRILLGPVPSCNVRFTRRQ